MGKINIKNKECAPAGGKKSKEQNKRHKAEYDKAYRADNAKVISDRSKVYYKDNIEKVSDRGKKYRVKNIKKIKKSTKTWREKNKAYIKSIKESSKCKLCGNKDFRVLQFHHVDPGYQGMGIPQLINRNRDLIKSEIDKCDVLCANCHCTVHYNMRKENGNEVS